jgi:hypothetical protein
MKSSNLVKIGGILFFIGVIFIIYSWNSSYPITISPINDNSFFKFFPTLWPGIIFSFIGLFFMAYFSKNKIIEAFCSSLVPLLLYIPAFFFSYIPSSDCGNARGQFLVFHNTGINSQVIPYFEFPNYFSLNEIIHRVVGIDEKGIALISFILYGALLGLSLHLFFFNLKKEHNIQLIPFLLVSIYFIGMFSFLNYQWVPQTLALVYFFLLLYISTYMLSNPIKTKWKFLFILLFIPLLFTHAILPIIFLIFFAILTIKNRYLLPILLVMASFYLIVVLYQTVIHFHLYVVAFEQSVSGFGGEYTKSITSSFKAPSDLIDQIISFFNRMTIPMIWIIASIGTIILFLKKKINYLLISLGFVGFLYIGVGIFFSVLGLRAAQMLFIPLTIGFMFFISKWKKLTIALIVIILVLSVFGPMRTAYNYTQFQTDEEAVTCDFLGMKLLNVTNAKVAISQVNWGYSTSKYSYLIECAIRPGSRKFLFFNDSLNKKEYIVYNSNLGKEILEYVLIKEQLNNELRDFKVNNKIYDGGTTFIINGVNRNNKIFY